MLKEGWVEAMLRRHERRVEEAKPIAAELGLSCEEVYRVLVALLDDVGKARDVCAASVRCRVPAMAIALPAG